MECSVPGQPADTSAVCGRAHTQAAKQGISIKDALKLVQEGRRMARPPPWQSAPLLWHVWSGRRSTVYRVMYAWLQAQPNAHFMSQLLLHEREGLFEVLCAYLPSILVPYCVSQSWTNRNPHAEV